MSSKGNYLKWTGRLVEEFSSKGFDLGSTSQSFYKSFNNQTSSLQQNQNQMPQNYRRYADSFDAKRNNYSSSSNLHGYLSNLPFVEYSHNSQKYSCSEQCGLKKKSKQQQVKKKKVCQYCCGKKEAIQQQKVVQNRPIIIKEIQRVFVPTPPTIIRQIVRPPVMIHQPHILAINPRPQVHQVIGPRITRIQSQPRPASVGRVHFNYTTPNFREVVVPAQVKRSVILTPTKKEVVTTPYKLLEFSMKGPEELSHSNVFERVEKVNEVPRIIISQPVKAQMKFEKDQFQQSNQDDNFMTSHFISSVGSRQNGIGFSQISSLKVQPPRRRIFNEQPLHTFKKIS